MHVDQAMETLSRKYGFYSVATLLLKHGTAVETLNRYVRSPAVPVLHDAGVQRAILELRDHYLVGGAGPVRYDHSRHLSTREVHGVILTTYDRAAFETLYPGEGGSHSWRIERDDATAMRADSFYIYALDEDLGIRLSRRTFSMEEIVMGVRHQRVSHAHLVAEANLTCAAAGEAIFVKRDDARVAAVLLNNKSGHFRPSRSSLRLACRVFAAYFGIPEEMVFPLCIERQP